MKAKRAMEKKKLGLIFLVDNSPKSINSDYYPSRLDYQKNAITKLVEAISNPEFRKSSAYFGVIAMSFPEDGVICNLTSKRDVFNHELDKIKIGNQDPNLEKALHIALSSFEIVKDETEKRISLFISSSINISRSGMNMMNELLKVSEVSVDLYNIVGDEIENDIQQLHKSLTKLKKSKNKLYTNLNKTKLDNMLYKHIWIISEKKYGS